MTIKVIGHTDIVLTEVMALGKKNAKTLGMFPEGAFIDHAKRKNILIAIENNQLLGYLLFRITQSKGIISVAHLCIDTEQRNKGIAKALLDALKEKYKNLFKGIALSCRKDYTEASKFYEKNQFKAIKEVRSRSQQENYLVKWYYDFGNSDLFSDITLLSNKLNVLLDANIIIKLRDEPNAQNTEAHALNADWLDDEVEYFFAPETYNEINRDSDKTRALATREFLNNFQAVNFNPENRDGIFAELSILLTGTTVNDISDKKQLAECISSGVTYFVTTDEEILNLSETILNKYSVRVLRPTELILFIDQLKNKSDYLSFRVAGANYEYKKLGQEDINVLIDSFVDTTIKKHELRTTLTNIAADVKNSDIRWVKDNDANCLGFFAAQVSNGYLKVPAIKIQKNKISEVLFYQMVNDIIHLAISKSANIINIEELSLSESMIEILYSYGFQQKEGLWYKIVLFGQEETEALLNSSELLKNNWNVPLVHRKFKALKDTEKEVYKLELERKLWPVKLTDIEIPTYIIPIKPLWAAHLFDHYQASHNLFGSKPELAWHRENIYYRNIRPVTEKIPARILWYISADNNNPIGRERGIVACSYLDEVHTGSAKILYQKFKNYGVYEWKDILEAANKDAHKEMKAIKFSDTEVFKKHISFDKVSEVMQKHGKSQNTFASPVEVSKEIFNDIYKIGKELK
jgi:ribosomal protein S18 acetylase RimI-like enzyme/predicted nucleic acid-binding protein